MNCPKCNGKVSIQNKQCPFCKMDLSIYHKIFSLSNYYYNEGLSKAKVRDLSGAIIVLKKSLELNKRNTDARNLLGLVYFEMGETVSALSSWVISKHLQPENNEADRYMNSIQRNANKLDILNQTIKKYNIALQSAKSGNHDLAILQLKKVTSMNPRFVKAWQLLALLYLKNSEKERAKKCLQRAIKIDVANTMTLTYLETIVNENDEQEAEETGSIVEQEPHVPFMPVSSYKEEKPNVRAWINLVIGAAIGVACGYFLFVPAAERAVHQQYKTESTKLDEKLSVYTAQITSLENENKKLKEEAGKLQSELDSIVIPEYDENMYDNLFDAFNLYMTELAKPEAERNMQQVAALLLTVKETALENETAAKLYATMKDATFVTVAAELYEVGHNQYLAGKYEDALKTLNESYGYNENDASTIYFIGRTYQRLGENDQAKKYYNKIIKNFADTKRYSEAKARLAEIGD